MMGAGTPMMPPPPPGDIHLGAMGPGGAPKKRRSPLVLSIIGLVAVLAIGGVAWAGVAYFNTEGTDTETSLPASTKAFISFNLDVSKDEQLKLADVAEKFPELTKENDPQKMVEDELKKLEDTDSDLKGNLSDWVGLSGSTAIWSDSKDNPYVLVSIDSRDDAKAKSGLKDLEKTGPGEGKMGYVVSDGHAMIAFGSSDSQNAAKAAAAEAKKSPLSDSDAYSEAADWLGDDQVVTAWADMKPAWAAAKKMMGDSNSPLGSDGTMTSMLESYDKQMQGKVAMGASATDYGLELKTRTFDGKDTPKGSPDLANKFAALPKSDLAGAIAFPDDMTQGSLFSGMMAGGLGASTDPSGEMKTYLDALSGGTATLAMNGFASENPAGEGVIETTSADKAQTLASLGEQSGGFLTAKADGNKVTMTSQGYTPGSGTMADEPNVKKAVEGAPKDLTYLVYADLSKMIPADEKDYAAMKGLSYVQGTDDNDTVGYVRLFVG
jgi:hypothetical protein